MHHLVVLAKVYARSSNITTNLFQHIEAHRLLMGINIVAGGQNHRRRFSISRISTPKQRVRARHSNTEVLHCIKDALCSRVPVGLEKSRRSYPDRTGHSLRDPKRVVALKQQGLRTIYFSYAEAESHRARKKERATSFPTQSKTSISRSKSAITSINACGRSLCFANKRRRSRSGS